MNLIKNLKINQVLHKNVINSGHNKNDPFNKTFDNIVQYWDGYISW